MNQTGFSLSIVVLAVGAACSDASDTLGASASRDGARTPGPPVATLISGPIWLDEPVENRAAPLGKGTLAVTDDESVAVAADPDRDAIFLVDLVDRQVTPLPVAPEAGLGHVLTQGAEWAFVAAQHEDRVLRVDLTQKRIAAELPVCSSPQGLALTVDGAALHVACRDGVLLTVNSTSGETIRSLQLDDDLRDVAVRGDQLVVTRFRSAEILILDAHGAEVGRFPAAPQGAQVAWRTLVRADGAIVVAYQATRPGTLAGNVYYGDGCSGALSQPSINLLNPPFAPAPGAGPVALLGAAGVVDIALSRDESSVVAVVPGNALALEPLDALTEVALQGVLLTGLCGPTSEPDPLREVPVSVAVGASDARYVLTREPATLQVVGGETILLSNESRQDTGFSMFHMNAGRNMACASCHPGGRDDGHTWQFDVGARRTQSLEGGVSHLAPFHWAGDLPTFADFVVEVMGRRMGLDVTPSDGELAALASFLDRIALPPARSVNATAAEQGRILFHDPIVSCGTCHAGPIYSDGQVHDVGTGEPLVTPPLLRAWARAPFLHTGCAPTLLDRFSVCGGGDQHGRTSHLSELELGNLALFLESL